MKKRELRRIFASFIAASTILAACGANEEAPKKENKQEEAQPSEDQKAEKEEQVKEYSVNNQLEAYNTYTSELGKVKEGQKADWNAVEEAYKKQMQEAVNQLNGEFAQSIEAAIEGGKTGQIDEIVALQLTDKLTQSYFYQKQKSLQKEIVADLEKGDKETAKAKFEEIKKLSTEIFIPTAEKRDNYYQLTGEDSIAENINNGLTVQEEALTQDKKDDFNVYIQLTDKSIYKIFYLAANGYAEKMDEAGQAGEEEKLKIMQAEAYGFFQAIKDSLSGGDEDASKQLNTLFALDNDPKAIKAAEVKSLFNKAIKGKIFSYHEKAPAALKENKEIDAKISALEGNMFTNMIEIQIKDQLGEQKAKELSANAEKWFQQISENKVDEAKATSEAILADLNQIK